MTLFASLIGTAFVVWLALCDAGSTEFAHGPIPRHSIDPRLASDNDALPIYAINGWVRFVNLVLEDAQQINQILAEYDQHAEEWARIVDRSGLWKCTKDGQPNERLVGRCLRWKLLVKTLPKWVALLRAKGKQAVEIAQRRSMLILANEAASIRRIYGKEGERVLQLYDQSYAALSADIGAIFGKPVEQMEENCHSRRPNVIVISGKRGQENYDWMSTLRLLKWVRRQSGALAKAQFGALPEVNIQNYRGHFELFDC